MEAPLLKAYNLYLYNQGPFQGDKKHYMYKYNQRQTNNTCLHYNVALGPRLLKWLLKLLNVDFHAEKQTSHFSSHECIRK